MKYIGISSDRKLSFVFQDTDSMELVEIKQEVKKDCGVNTNSVIIRSVNE